MKKSIFFVLSTFVATTALATTPISLPTPQQRIGMDLMEALQQRQSIRNFSSDSLSYQELSDVLWAAFGINRPETGKRTAPSAMNRQEIQIYAALASGLYRYDASGHQLIKVSDKDIRSDTGRQDWVAQAPLNLIYVSDFSQLDRGDDTAKKLISSTNAGFIGQNVYLYCAAAGLATVVRGGFDEQMLAKSMQLPEHMKIILTQTVGHRASASNP
ncbi:MAG TPA: SagB/ThcOx family dehydrogenase [bacterium]|nr:SagB/ThcOx family dehydrogenase [bacterium]HPG46991.1 SagB/ThcOx family dehydrogenase [bacterium]HPM99241.1 SagB/ThcOx family dehydrogenase [bacterium]